MVNCNHKLKHNKDQDYIFCTECGIKWKPEITEYLCNDECGEEDSTPCDDYTEEDKYEDYLLETGCNTCRGKLEKQVWGYCKKRDRLKRCS